MGRGLGRYVPCHQRFSPKVASKGRVDYHRSMSPPERRRVHYLLNSRFALASAVIVGGALSLACAFGSECGAGTVEKDGKCVADEASQGNSLTGDSAPGASPDSGEAGDAKAAITSFTSDVSQLTDGESAVFTIVVSGEATAGVLESVTGVPYGSFGTFSGPGSASVRLSWDQIGAVESIDFSQIDGKVQREFIARVYDSSGGDVQASTSLDLQCNGYGACDGQCVNMNVDEDNCGQCNTTCLGCSDAKCKWVSDCLATIDYEGMTTGAVCAALGGMCYTGDTLVGVMYPDSSCKTDHDEFLSCTDSLPSSQAEPGFTVYCYW